MQKPTGQLNGQLSDPSNRQHASDDGSGHDGAQRLDVWMYRTRLVKSRKRATELINKGRVRVKRHASPERIKKPGLRLRPGFEVIFARGHEILHVRMLSAAGRRGPASEAVSHYKVIQETT